ncbi:MAG TPA: circularly permuted type 2 ATP-grasp protein [Kouleothrix sp.]|uniref:circularly permuted type 2 ATP-grasp protein n=1 Tax=Kouleothrix sp. TaxID=2779161 RepID=UPI002CFE3BE1|nr:circularly permuted type 2 ATP-grasp protein [Kouleothrix sp.]
MLEQAISHYHALLDADTARATQAQLTAEQRARNLYFGERPLVSVLRPRFITHEQYALVQRACGTVTAAAHRLADAMLEDVALRADLALTPAEERLIAMHPGYPEASAHSRMDTFLTVDGRSLQFVEYNAESPAAIAYEDLLSDVFEQLPAMQRFAESYQVAKLPARQHLLAMLLKAWEAFGGTHPPAIAILDWKGLPTHSEFLLFQQYFREHNLEAVICSPDELRYADGRLYADTAEGTAQIDLVYKRVLTSEFLMRYGDAVFEHPLVQAYAAGSVCMVNSFRAKLLHKKSIFALLTDDAHQQHFSESERAAIARHVPWTRLVRPGASTYQGEAIDLLEFARKNQERLLLKPNDEYGGKGIVIGWETDAAAWAQALAEALQSPFVLQERVEIAYEDYPAMIDGALHIGRRLVDTDPFLFGTEVSGSLCRLSTVTLLNVTAGGGSTVPAFVIAEKTR